MDEELPETAYHEAGHAIAAALCGEQWTSASIHADGGGFTAIQFRPATHQANRAFISWAGPWAEARYVMGETAQDLVRFVLESGGGREDMEDIEKYWKDSTLAPHETEDQWGGELELAWWIIDDMARQLMDTRFVSIRVEGATWSRIHADGEGYAHGFVIQRDLNELI